ncbi:MAG: DUF4293 domain-containing protein [Rikenellaceae bacterium]|nr:DUF4293 domain-containing protein [Rikenellaceae bacterium]
MIQRIQTVYLLVTVILMCVICFLPLADFIDVIENTTGKLYGWGISTPEGCFIYPDMTILLGLTILLPLITVFLYRKRWLQIRMCIVEMVLLAGMQIYIIMHIVRYFNTDKYIAFESFFFSVTDIIPIAGIILMFLALRGIMKDEMLIKSLNRIR